MMNIEEEGKGCKVVIIGDGSVGKTCLLISFVENKFPAEYVPTIFDSYLYTLDETPMTLIDTAGQEEFGELRPLSYEGAHVFIICFALNNQTSLDNLDTTWYPEVRKHVQTTPNKTWLGNILVGTKADLRTPKNKATNVSTEQAQAKADKYNMTYYETSALTGDGLREIFIDCVQRYQDFQETGVSKAMESAALKRVSKIIDPTAGERKEGTAIMNPKKKGKCVVC